MLSSFKGPKSKKGKNVGQAILAPGQFLSRATTWADQVKICKDHDDMDTALIGCVPTKGCRGEHAQNGSCQMG